MGFLKYISYCIQIQDTVARICQIFYFRKLLLKLAKKFSFSTHEVISLDETDMSIVLSGIVVSHFLKTKDLQVI